MLYFFFFRWSKLLASIDSHWPCPTYCWSTQKTEIAVARKFFPLRSYFVFHLRICFRLRSCELDGGESLNGTSMHLSIKAKYPKTCHLKDDNTCAEKFAETYIKHLKTMAKFQTTLVLEDGRSIQVLVKICSLMRLFPGKILKTCAPLSS